MPAEYLAKEGTYTVASGRSLCELLRELAKYLPEAWRELLLGQISWDHRPHLVKKLTEWLESLGIRVYFGGGSTKVLAARKYPEVFLLLEMELARLQEKSR